MDGATLLLVVQWAVDPAQMERIRTGPGARRFVRLERIVFWRDWRSWVRPAVLVSMTADRTHRPAVLTRSFGTVLPGWLGWLRSVGWGVSVRVSLRAGCRC